MQLDPSGNVVIAVGGERASHTNNEQDSQIFVLAERSGTFYGKKMVKGKLYVIAGVLNGGSSAIPCDAPDAAAAAGRRHAGLPPPRRPRPTSGTPSARSALTPRGTSSWPTAAATSGSPCGENAYDVRPRVAVIPARTGTYYGQKMTVGDIYAIAGLGTKTG